MMKMVSTGPVFVLALVLALVVAAGAVSAHGEEIEAAKELIDSGVDCDSLNDDQLDMIGDYYMEQIHPGEAHELMDEMMGGEGSESLRQMHIGMARRFYCKDYTSYGGMMGSGMMGMMGPGMMGMMGNYDGGGMMGYGMMGNYGMMSGGGMVFYGFLWLVYLALAAFVFSVIFWVTRNWLSRKEKKK